MVSLPTTILVADDASPEAELALDTAVSLTLATGSQLSIVHVKLVSPYLVGATPSPVHVQRLEQEGRTLLDQRVQRVEQAGGSVDRAEVRLGRQVEREVVRAAHELEAGLLVVGGRGRRIGQRQALGDVSLHLVRDAPCSVLVVRHPADLGGHPGQGVSMSAERRQRR